ncbi:hypothetical protein [Herpetosiphon giganteus]|uniref:hypothetical protein n=1 Tax=Herpetosiphon giganteus TaxID=2029754 RepID=UPI00195CAAD8|nr:hypothetical protein [Herpetosiphon giganteus]MBM7842335.1 hypothetical protein [Herpetosiphon giganteus]
MINVARFSVASCLLLMLVSWSLSVQTQPATSLAPDLVPHSESDGADVINTSPALRMNYVYAAINLRSSTPSIDGLAYGTVDFYSTFNAATTVSVTISLTVDGSAQAVFPVSDTIRVRGDGFTSMPLIIRTSHEGFGRVVALITMIPNPLPETESGCRIPYSYHQSQIFLATKLGNFGNNQSGGLLNNYLRVAVAEQIITEKERAAIIKDRKTINKPTIPLKGVDGVIPDISFEPLPEDGFPEC